MKRKLILYYGRFIKLMKDIVERSMADNFAGVGAQMSYYFILAFFPFLIFLIALLSYTNITSEAFLGNLSGYLPSDVYTIVREAIKNTVNSRSTTLLSVGAFTTIWVASNGIEALTYGINSAYDLEETRPYWKLKLLNIAFTFALSTVYSFSLTMVVLGGGVAKKIFGYFQISGMLVYLWSVSRFVVPFVTIFIVFLIIYNYLPVKRIGLKKIIPGAIFATVGWIAISQLFSWYIENFGSLAQAYGSLGSIIILLLWLYWCGITIMIGAELNASLYYFRGSKKRG